MSDAGSRTRLLLVDLQRIFAEPASAWAAPGWARAATGCARLHEAFRPLTAFTRFLAPESPSGAWVDYYAEWPFALDPASAELYGFAAGVEVGDAPVIDRTTFGKWDAETARVLGSPSELVVAGVSTDCCVLTTVLQAADAGVRVRVVADACAGASDEDHERALLAMALYAPLVTVTTVDEVLAQVAAA